MIEYIMAILLIVFVIFLLFPLLSSLPAFLINFFILALLAFRIPGDIKKRGLYPFYLLSTLFTTIIFISYPYLSSFFSFLHTILLLNVTIATLLIFLLAHGFHLLVGLFPSSKKDSHTHKHK